MISEAHAYKVSMLLNPDNNIIHTVPWYEWPASWFLAFSLSNSHIPGVPQGYEWSSSRHDYQCVLLCQLEP